MNKFAKISQGGFTLVELAIVLIIVTLLTSGLMMSLMAQQEMMASAETQRRLNEARDCLVSQPPMVASPALLHQQPLALSYPPEVVTAIIRGMGFFQPSLWA
jgi:prepilin-type N-terminal cleavage/methylation domain-containing protein